MSVDNKIYQRKLEYDKNQLEYEDLIKQFREE